MEQMRMVKCPKWLIQKFETHIVVKHDDKGTVTRINRYDSQFPHMPVCFNFSGKNPLSLPKAVQQSIDYWLGQQCRAAKQGIWDCEAWTDEPNTTVVL